MVGPFQIQRENPGKEVDENWHRFLDLRSIFERRRSLAAEMHMLFFPFLDI